MIELIGACFIALITVGNTRSLETNFQIDYNSYAYQ